MYSDKLLNLARALDRMIVGVHWARTDLHDAFEERHSDATDLEWESAWQRPETYLAAMEASIPALEMQLYELLAQESKQWGEVHLKAGRIIVPEWVTCQFNYLDGDEYNQSERYIRERHAQGYKVLFDRTGADTYIVNVLPSTVPDELIEVWWSRVDLHAGCGMHGDVSGFLTRVEGMGWQVFAVEQ